MYETVGKGCLKWHEMQEVLQYGETGLNNRPLSYVEDDIQAPTLTPNSMLFINSNTIPELEVYHVEESDLRKRPSTLQGCRLANVEYRIFA